MIRYFFSGDELVQQAAGAVVDEPDDGLPVLEQIRAVARRAAVVCLPLVIFADEFPQQPTSAVDEPPPFATITLPPTIQTKLLGDTIELVPFVAPALEDDSPPLPRPVFAPRAWALPIVDEFWKPIVDEPDGAPTWMRVIIPPSLPTPIAVEDVGVQLFVPAPVTPYEYFFLVSSGPRYPFIDWSGSRLKFTSSSGPRFPFTVDEF